MVASSTNNPGWSLAGRAAALGLAYWLAVTLAIELVNPVEKIALFWPPNAIAAGALMLSRRRDWPWLIAAMSIAYFAGRVPSGHFPLYVYFGLCAANIVEVLIVVMAAGTVSGDGIRHETLGKTLPLAIVAAIPACIASAVIGAGFVVSALEKATYWNAFAVWFTGDLAGLTMVLPAMVAWLTPGSPRLRDIGGVKAVEGACIAVTLAAIGLLFHSSFGRDSQLVIIFPYLAFPVLIWAAIRLGMRGAATVTLAVGLFVVELTFLGQGPFSFQALSAFGQVILMKVGVITISATTIFLAAATAERRQAEDALRQSYHRDRQLFDSIPYGVSIVSWKDRNKRLYVNERFVEMLGAGSAGQVLATPVVESYVDPRDLKRMHEPADLSAVTTAEMERRRFDGTRWWCRLHRRRTMFEGEDAVITWHEDISDRKQAEARFQDALESLGEGFSLWDAEDRLVMFNERYRQSMAGVEDILRPGLRFEDSVRTLMTRKLRAVPPGGEEAWVRERLARHRNPDPGKPFEVQFTDGQWIEIHEFRMSDGGTVTIRTDITRRKRSEEMLRAVAEGVSGAVGEHFFETLVEYLAKTLGTDYAVLGRIAGDGGSRIESIAVHAHGRTGESFAYPLAGTPCERVLAREDRAFPRDVQRIFPGSAHLRDRKVDAYVGAPLFDSAGRPLGILAVLHRRPIDDPERALYLLEIFAARAGAELERLRTEGALRESEERFKDMAEATSDWFWEMDADLRFTFFSDRRQDLTGVAPHVHVGMTRWEIAGVDPDTDPKWRAHKAQLERHLPFRDFEYEYPGVEEGGILATTVGGKPVFDDDGAFVGYRGTATDITEKNRAEEALQEANQRFRTLVDNLPMAVNLKDKDRRFILVNKRHTEWYRHEEEEVLGKRASEIMGEDTVVNAARDAQEEELLRTGRVVTRMETKRNPDGSPRHVELIKFPIVASKGETAIFGTIEIDVTERREAEESLRKALSEAEEANRAKSDFLATMSHEFRTPLNAILGFADIMGSQILGPVANAKYLEYAADIRASGTHLLALVNDLLDLSAIEAGKRPLVNETVPVAEMLDECLKAIRQRAIDTGIEITTKVPSDLPPLYADRRAVRQILLNVLSNAVKFTDEGGTVSVSASGADGETVFRVDDTGIGIPPDKLSQLTDPFTQVDMDPYRSHEGWGLGLTITQSLVELHGGVLDIQSQIGKGTSVTVTLPSSQA